MLKQREPKKTWYWIPFTGASIMLFLVVFQLFFMKIPKLNSGQLPDASDAFRTVGVGVILVILFIIQGINGVYQYNKKRSNKA